MITQCISEKEVYNNCVVSDELKEWYTYKRAYATYYKGQITTGRTASESINRMLEKII